jgi:hypothetical protein
MVLISVAASCDTFHEDEVADDNLVAINPAQVDYYVPDFDIQENASVVINLREVIVSSHARISIKVHKNPDYGAVTWLDEYFLKYTPSSTLYEDSNHDGERKDQFEISFVSGGSIVAVQPITVRLGNFPCGLYAVEDRVVTQPGTPVSFPAAWNDHLCDIRVDNIAQSIALDPQHGSAEVNGTTITYTPEVDYEGLDEFVYVVNAFGQENFPSQGPLTSYGLVTVHVGE